MKPQRLICLSAMGFAWFLIIFTFSWPKTEAAYMRNSEIFNIGWIFSMPYDIGNTLRAPLAGPLSIILTACLSIILFFGLAASPVYYLFGTPKRKYHVNDAIQTPPVKVYSARNFDHAADFTTLNITYESEGRGFGGNDGQDFGFVDSFFYFLPQEDVNCRKLLVCHSHGFLTILPTYFLHVYRMFSRRTMEIPDEYQEAIQTGLTDQGSCMRKYSNCTKDPLEIASESFYHLFLGSDECSH